MANKNPHKTEEQKRIVIFDDRFEKSSLGPDWLISPGRGSYSLADKPGHLRYIIDADHTARVAGSGQNYAKALWLIRPFLGNLKMDIATLLVSLDNAAVMPMTIRRVAVDI